MKYAGMVFSVVLAVTNLVAAPVAIDSPGGQISSSFDVKNGGLFYSVSKGGTPVVASSRVEVFPGAKMEVVDQSVRENDTSWKPVWGQFSTIRDHHRELTLSLAADGLPVTLLCRAFDTGIGFRFVLPEEYRKKIDLFEFLKVMPAIRGDFRVPHAKIGEYITFARRSGTAWFVASVNDPSERTLEAGLDFLEPGTWRPAADTVCGSGSVIIFMIREDTDF